MTIDQIEILVSQSRYEMAYDQLQEFLSSDPMNYSGLTLMTVSCINLDRFEEAESALQAMGQIFPDNPYALYLYANLEIKRNRLDRALQILDQGIAIAPHSGHFFDLKSRIHYTKKQYDQAAISAQKALEINPQDVDAMNSLSKALNAKGDSKQANVIIDKALERDPNNYETHANYGFRALEKGQVKKATEHFQQSLLVNPSFGFAQMGMKEAMKAKFPLYRWLLQFQLYMAKQGNRAQIGLIIGIYILSRVLGYLADQGNGLLQILVYIVFGALVLFIFSSWILDPIMNFMLYTNQKGRLALDRSETKEAKGAAVSLSLIVLGLVVGLLTGNPVFYMLALTGFFPLFYYRAIFAEQASSRHNRLSLLFFAGTLLACIGAVLAEIFGSEWSMAMLSAAALITLAYTWVGNSVFWKQN